MSRRVHPKYQLMNINVIHLSMIFVAMLFMLVPTKIAVAGTVIRTPVFQLLESVQAMIAVCLIVHIIHVHAPTQEQTAIIRIRRRTGTGVFCRGRSYIARAGGRT